MPWYKIEINLGISDKLAKYIIDTYSGEAHINIPVFDRSRNYTKIIAFAPSIAAINNALADIRTRLVEVEETPYNPPPGP